MLLGNVQYQRPQIGCVLGDTTAAAHDLGDCFGSKRRFQPADGLIVPVFQHPFDDIGLSFGQAQAGEIYFPKIGFEKFRNSGHDCGLHPLPARRAPKRLQCFF
ncbi:MAG: hypothetical protein C4530_24030 [Desulfobacteraceae bacterium]|nr:MAG: hypothetical protein C4530_24030 [Desulfobacteraceae bacterium]